MHGGEKRRMKRQMKYKWKWDRVIAFFIVIFGSAYAGYSVTQYIEKLQAIKPVSNEKMHNLPQTASLPEKQVKEEPWIVVPKEDRPKKGEHFADLIIPKLNAQMPIIEGTHEDELERGVGHYSGSVLPGEPDNAVLSGHRDTVFRRIGELKVGDELIVRSSHGTFVYEIQKTWVTKPDDRTVIVPHHQPILTLTTCYPFTYVGPAPDRYIIQSRLKGKVIQGG